MDFNDQFSIVGIDSLSKFIDSLTTKNSDYTIVVTTDEFQSLQPSDKRSFIVKVASKFDGDIVTIEKE